MSRRPPQLPPTERPLRRRTAHHRPPELPYEGDPFHAR
ncbi:hypothetical protein GZL_03898 [Streptomyces sp. 769]|nr:hypothetical protein GZL_03898 [Streptomyces sp. 769]